MTVRGSGSQSGTWISWSTSSQKNRRGFWPGVANTGSFKTKSRGGQSSGSSRGSVQQSAHRHSHAQGSFQSPSQRPVMLDFPQCQLCGRFHLGECLRGAGVCYQCGQVGHMKRDCPDRPQGSGAPQKGQTGRPRAQGRVFAVTQQDAEESPDVVMGMLSIFGRNAHCLIDLGATHSFISYALAIYADCILEPLDSELVVATPVGDSLLANSVYKNCVVKVNDQELKANLIHLDIYDFDVILGMDFLATNRASVDCFRKEVVFRKPGEPEIILSGER
ncbi:DNA/RNA polymerase superfamily protein [Abeliophyllum distichum]|uniref:DNA/RNA polymerase superfamily protein n=1 Tax=Abeliophyllum distichum TaxID=126358 RepID=A0ABD1SD58_9LAMI